MDAAVGYYKSSADSAMRSKTMARERDTSIVFDELPAMERLYTAQARARALNSKITVR